ncbi:sugar transferase [Luteolibacter luteus]|uniref:Sugar transferase n=1 Tax=Luteolibacter luteus TaxID=2728835 RepID=A0A858RJF8_9BACT|nr:sugar transferase [Luteolibacter luteus]QJE97057.1 sugar transferase [Luteolibacter luteus]
MRTQFKERRIRALSPRPRASEPADRPDRPTNRTSFPVRLHLRKRTAGVSISPRPRGSARREPIPTWKRWSDMVCVAMSFPFALPLIGLVVLWIRLVSHGPALFRQERIGLGGRRFTLYKFRTMRHGASTAHHEAHVERLVESDQPMVKLDCLGDSRLIPGGRFLRMAGLDELPQFLNVLRGEMSLVGPRPCLAEEYGFFTSSQRERFTVLPGLTGLWQVKGKNRTTFREMNAMDVHYARKSSPMLDVAIMVRTPLALVQQMADCLAHQRQHCRAEGLPVPASHPTLGYGGVRHFSDHV